MRRFLVYHLDQSHIAGPFEMLSGVRPHNRAAGTATCSAAVDLLSRPTRRTRRASPFDILWTPVEIRRARAHGG